MLMPLRSSAITETISGPWWQSVVEDYAVLPIAEIPKEFRSGVRFSAICVNVPQHLQYLLSSFLSNGGKLLKARLPTQNGFAEALSAATTLLQEARLGEACAFVNASGLGARKLLGDHNVFPTKGQTVLVKGESKFAKTTDRNSYVIPRPGSGTTILGGTREGCVW